MKHRVYVWYIVVDERVDVDVSVWVACVCVCVYICA